MPGPLTQQEFEVASRLAAGRTVADLGHVLRSSFVGAVDVDVARVVSDLAGRGLVSGGRLSGEGWDAIETYRVRRAVIMAAGFGSRLLPVTRSVPKPLARVGGVRIIDTIIDALVRAGVGEIYVVRGYLGEQFEPLLAKYPGVRLIDNDLYDSCNNISSVFAARDFLAGAYVIEGDLFVRNADVLCPYQYCTNYLGVPVASTDDWCFTLDGDRIADIGIGGVNCCHMYGVSWWSESDGTRLVRDVASAMSDDAWRSRYWDEVALCYARGSYDVRVRRCEMSDIDEIDTYEEFLALGGVWEGDARV